MKTLEYIKLKKQYGEYLYSLHLNLMCYYFSIFRMYYFTIYKFLLNYLNVVEIMIFYQESLHVILKKKIIIKRA